MRQCHQAMRRVTQTDAGPTFWEICCKLEWFLWPVGSSWWFLCWQLGLSVRRCQIVLFASCPFLRTWCVDNHRCGLFSGCCFAMILKLLAAGSVFMCVFSVQVFVRNLLLHEVSFFQTAMPVMAIDLQFFALVAWQS